MPLARGSSGWPACDHCSLKVNRHGLYARLHGDPGTANRYNFFSSDWSSRRYNGAADHQSGTAIRRAIMTEPAPVVFLLDVDNTLIDNDRIIEDMRRHLTKSFGKECQERYWKIFEERREAVGYADYLGA